MYWILFVKKGISFLEIKVRMPENKVFFSFLLLQRTPCN